MIKTLVSHRTCGLCKWWKRKRPFQKVRKHRCVFNHSDSARMMETSSGVQGIKELAKSGTPVEYIEADGDNTLIAQLHIENIFVKKLFVRSHVVKNIGKRLYQKQKEHKQVSKSVTTHIIKRVKYVFAKHQGDSKGLEENLKAIVPH